MTMAIDTLKYAKRMETAGIPREHAEAIAAGASDEVASQLATKGDLDVAVAKTKSDIEVAVARLESMVIKTAIGTVIATSTILAIVNKLSPVAAAVPAK